MAKHLLAITAAIGIVGFTSTSANAQSFVSRGHASSRTETTTTISAPKSSFDSNFERFYQDLGETGDRMKMTHAMVECLTASKHTAQAISNQIDTGTTAQRGFLNSQTQALNSGGTYNTPVRTNIGLFPDPFFN